MTLTRITAAAAVQTLAVSSMVGTVTASTARRQLAGDLVEYARCRAVACSCCVYGRTSIGKLKVQPGALRFPTPIDRVKLTEEHDRDKSRGRLAAMIGEPRPGQRVRVTASVSDGPLGDAALLEAADGTRDGFSFDVVDARVVGDSLVDALVVAVGQVGIPAFDDMRIDSIAASQTARATAGLNREGNPMLTPEELAELNSLASTAPEDRTEAQTARLQELISRLNGDTEAPAPASPPAPAVTASTPAPAPAPVPAPAPSVAVTASLSGGAVPSGVGGRPAPARTNQDDALRSFVRTIVDALSPGGGGAQAITAALADVTSTQHSSTVEAPAWSGELWSGVEYVSKWTDLFASGDLTNWEGHGWRWAVKPEMQDYAGDKAAIPSNVPTTEPSDYQAARMAVGHDIDRKFYDFPNEAFLLSYVQAVRESWARKLDAKVAAYANAQAVAVAGDPATTLLKAAARGVRALDDREVGAATFVAVSAADVEDLMDVSQQNLPAFLQLFGIDPSNWRVMPSAQLAAGTVLVGARQSATVRTLPGSPIRVSAQHLANGGIDEAFFGYWAIEEHHTQGIAAVTYAPA